MVARRVAFTAAGGWPDPFFYAHEGIELAWRTWLLGFSLKEIPITFSERREGASKMSQRIVLEALWQVAKWSVRRARPPVVPHPLSVARRP